MTHNYDRGFCLSREMRVMMILLNVMGIYLWYHFFICFLCTFCYATALCIQGDGQLQAAYFAPSEPCQSMAKWNLY